LALKPVDNETFYREVDEELRRDQLLGYWQRYGKLIIAGIVLLLLLLAAGIWWHNQRTLKAGARGEQLSGAFDDISAGKKTAAAAKLDGLVASGTPGYKAAALFTKADLAVEGNDLKTAAGLFRQVADDGALPQPYRDLATVRMTAIEIDSLKPEAVVARLKPLASAGSPWFGSAGEMVAISYMKMNKPQEAGRLFAAIAKDAKVPDSIRSRAAQMAGSLGVDAVQGPSAAPQEGK
jgi:hypothetical protein